MEASRVRLVSHDKAPGLAFFQKSLGGVVVGPILSAAKLKALLLAEANSTRVCKALDLSHNNIRKITLSLGEVASLDFECITDLDLHGNLLVSLDGHSLPFPHLQNLTASNCRIRSLTNFGSHFRLRRLNLGANQLTHIMGLANTPLRFTLQALSVADNQIGDFKALAPLSTFESLEALDLRGNPVADFGIVAEGFALLCCHTLRRLNGRTVSEEVREAVDTWAVDDVCGKATAATVEAFRDVLLHPDGPSLLSTSPQHRVGHVKRPVRSSDSEQATGSSTDKGKHFSSAAHPSADFESSDYTVIVPQPQWNSSQRLGSSVSRLSSASGGDRSCSMGPRGTSAVTLASSSEAQGALEVPMVQHIGSAREAKQGVAKDASVEEDGTDEGCQKCISCNAHSHMQDEIDNVGKRLSGGMSDKVWRGSAECHKNGSSCETCALCLCPPLPHVQYYHGRKKPGVTPRGVAAANRLLRRAPCVTRGCIRSCTSTQTPAGWIRPLDLENSDQSVSSLSPRDDCSNAAEMEPSGGFSQAEDAGDSPASDGRRGQDSTFTDVKDETDTEIAEPEATDEEAVEEEEVLGGDDEDCKRLDTEIADPEATDEDAVEAEEASGGDAENCKRLEGSVAESEVYADVYADVDE